MKRFDVEKIDGTGLIQIEAKDLRHAKEKAASEIYDHGRVRYSAGSYHEYGQTLSLVETTQHVLHERAKINKNEAKDLELIEDRLQGKFDQLDANLVLKNLRANRQNVIRCLTDILRDDDEGKIISSKYGAFMGLMKRHTEGLKDFFEIVA